MVISAYQVNNVLRVYGDQLRQSRLSTRPKSSATSSPDKISISEGGRRKAIIDKISADIIEKITRFGPNDTVEKEVFEKLESEYGRNLTVIKNGPSELLFKEIDENGETINSLSIEDSNFLSYKLKEITQKTIGNNMVGTLED